MSPPISWLRFSCHPVSKGHTVSEDRFNRHGVQMLQRLILQNKDRSRAHSSNEKTIIYFNFQKYCTAELTVYGNSVAWAGT